MNDKMIEGMKYERFKEILLSEIAKLSVPKVALEKKLADIPDDFMFIDTIILVDTIKRIDFDIKNEERATTPKTKFLYVEDGSVDVDNLREELSLTNPEIQVVIYRQGSNPPILQEQK